MNVNTFNQRSIERSNKTVPSHAYEMSSGGSGFPDNFICRRQLKSLSIQMYSNIVIFKYSNNNNNMIEHRFSTSYQAYI